MPRFDERIETVYARDRKEWRRWLKKNHRTSQGVWLVFYKVGSGQESVRYSEAVKEALCFGWIDSKVNSLDEVRYKQIFTPRKAKSAWSKLNKGYIAELIEQGLMAEAGLAKIEAAKQDGSWTKLDAIEELRIPPDLEKALASDKVAGANFKAFSNSVKKGILFWIESAKRAETREKRISETVRKAAQNKRANFDK
jgi:uncharacterized protein YdeI (YjbR/CyaY-like superfamily)